MTGSMKWRGAEVLAAVHAATKAAIDEITEQSALDAEESHEWQNRSGNLSRNIVSRKAKMTKGELVGRFGVTGPKEPTWIMKSGSHTGWYGFFLERKTPFLRPAADRNFPLLAIKIRGHYEPGAN